VRSLHPVKDDRGSMIPLVLGFLIITTMLVTVVTDVGSMWLARRSLQAAVDGAALAGSREVDLGAIYSGRSRGPLTLDVPAASAAVRRFMTENPSSRQFRSLRLTRVQVSGSTVSVRAQATIAPPFLSLFNSGQVVITAAASAETVAG
jgi:uncharacterized membrane protein